MTSCFAIWGPKTINAQKLLECTILKKNENDKLYNGGRQVLWGGSPVLGVRQGHYAHLPDPIADTTTVAEIP